MAQLKDLLVNGKSKFLDMVTAVGMKLSTGGSDTTFWNTNGGVKTASEIVSAAGLLGNYVKLDAGSSEQTIKNTANNLTNGSIEIWRAIDGGYSMIGFATGSSKTKLGYLGFTSSPNIPTFRNTSGNDYSLLHTGNYSSYALPLAGGTLTKASENILSINNTATNAANNFIYFKNNGTNKASVGYYYELAFIANEIGGYARIGVKDDGTPVYRDNSTGGTGHDFTLLHTGNAYWANVKASTTSSTTTEPTFKTTTIQNDSTHKCIMSYDSTEECMKFTFA